MARGFVQGTARVGDPEVIPAAGFTELPVVTGQLAGNSHV